MSNEALPPGVINLNGTRPTEDAIPPVWVLHIEMGPARLYWGTEDYDLFISRTGTYRIVCDSSKDPPRVTLTR